MSQVLPYVQHMIQAAYPHLGSSISVPHLCRLIASFMIKQDRCFGVDGLCRSRPPFIPKIPQRLLREHSDTGALVTVLAHYLHQALQVLGSHPDLKALNRAVDLTGVSDNAFHEWTYQLFQRLQKQNKMERPCIAFDRTVDTAMRDKLTRVARRQGARVMATPVSSVQDIIGRATHLISNTVKASVPVGRPGIVEFARGMNFVHWSQYPLSYDRWVTLEGMKKMGSIGRDPGTILRTTTKSHVHVVPPHWILRSAYFNEWIPAFDFATSVPTLASDASSAAVAMSSTVASSSLSSSSSSSSSSAAAASTTPSFSSIPLSSSLKRGARMSLQQLASGSNTSLNIKRVKTGHHDMGTRPVLPPTSPIIGRPPTPPPPVLPRVVVDTNFGPVWPEQDNIGNIVLQLGSSRVNPSSMPEEFSIEEVHNSCTFSNLSYDLSKHEHCQYFPFTGMSS